MPIVVQAPGGSPGVGACSPWATVDDLCEPCSNDAFDAPLMGDYLQAASDILFYLSGRQYSGECVTTVRPTARSIAFDHGRPFHNTFASGSAGYWPPGWYGGSWYPCGMCSCNQLEVANHTVAAVTLGVYPVTSVLEVKVDGVDQDLAGFGIANNRWLVRKGDLTIPTFPPRAFPCSQRVDLDDDQVGTWSVKVGYGLGPGTAGVLACAELACQLALLLTPSQQGKCRLNPRVTQLSRAGESMVLLDPLLFIDKGRTGLYLCDAFLRAVNPYGISRRATVMSPDVGSRTFTIS